MREIMRKGFNDIEQASDNDYSEAVKQVTSNINDAFERHKKELSTLNSSTLKLLGGDIGSLIVVGTIDIAALSTGSFFLDVVGALASLTGVSTVKELFGAVRNFRSEKNKLRNRHNRDY
jgi:hypothetical protein